MVVSESCFDHLNIRHWSIDSNFEFGSSNLSRVSGVTISSSTAAGGRNARRRRFCAVYVVALGAEARGARIPNRFMNAAGCGPPMCARMSGKRPPYLCGRCRSGTGHNRHATVRSELELMATLSSSVRFKLPMDRYCREGRRRQSQSERQVLPVATTDLHRDGGQHHHGAPDRSKLQRRRN